MGDRARAKWAEKWGLLCPFFEGGGGIRSPCNTVLPWPRPTSVPSGILIHPQYTNVTDRQDKTGRQTDRQTDRTRVR